LRVFDALDRKYGLTILKKDSKDSEFVEFLTDFEKQTKFVEDAYSQKCVLLHQSEKKVIELEKRVGIIKCKRVKGFAALHNDEWHFTETKPMINDYKEAELILPGAYVGKAKQN